MSKRTTAPRAGQWAAGATLLAVALATGGVGLFINISHGLERGPAAAALFACADIARIALPFAAAIIGWSRQLRVTAIACTAISLYCVGSALFGGHEARHAAQATAATAYADHRADVARVRDRLAAIRETGGAEALKAEAAQTLKRTEGCKDCRTLRDRAAELTRRAGEAETRDTLTAELARLTASGAALAATPIEASGKGVIDALVAMLLVETLVWLSIPGLRMIAAAHAARPRRKATPKATAKPAAKTRRKAAPRPATPKAPRRRSAPAEPPATIH